MSGKTPIRVEPYAPKFKACWDGFVRAAKNGVFLFHRDYLEYHADRFHDFSMMFFQEDRLVALMPANLRDGACVSHGGLTFGGIITDQRMTTGMMLEVFRALMGELQMRGVQKLVYKAVPHIYHTLPAEEDLYALFLRRARLARRDVSSTVACGRKLPLLKGRRGALKRGKGQGIKVARSESFARFMAIEEANLESSHGVRPAHSAAELQLLAGRFPENIKLFAAERQGEMLAGVVIYESSNVAHAQYIGATPQGKSLGAIDCIVDVLLNEVYAGKPYFDFGISTVDNGRTLNAGLVQNKESYGARATMYDFYELSLEK